MWKQAVVVVAVVAAMAMAGKGLCVVVVIGGMATVQSCSQLAAGLISRVVRTRITGVTGRTFNYPDFCSWPMLVSTGNGYVCMHEQSCHLRFTHLTNSPLTRDQTIALIPCSVRPVQKQGTLLKLASSNFDNSANQLWFPTPVRFNPPTPNQSQDVF